MYKHAYIHIVYIFRNLPTSKQDFTLCEFPH